MKKAFYLFILTLFSFQAFCQLPKYWILLKDKPVEDYNYQEHLSMEAIKKRQLMQLDLVQYTDIPLDKDYLEKISKKGIKMVNQSKWLNAVSAEITDDQKKWLVNQYFVEDLIPIYQPVKTLAFNTNLKEKLEEQQYSKAISQMEASLMEEAGLSAEGVIIGVIDAGFFGLKKNKHLKHIVKKDRVLGVKDFVNPERRDLFNDMATFSDDHGTMVVEHIAGIKPKGQKFGFAVDASFYLARSEKGDTETRTEEDYWIRAMEWMDSLGVRIINTSLGYAIGFDDPAQNYQKKDMNGKTAMISKAAQIASDEKGLLLIVSAGNEGNDSDWRIISAPADAKGVLSVGATGAGGLKAGYSSIGPDFLPYIKPNVACYSLMGTSFSAPIITGFAACLMQKKPEATGIEIKEIIERSGNLFPYGNNFLGYGVPKTSTALRIAEGEEVVPDIKKKIAMGKKETWIKLTDKTGVEAVIFHKKNQHLVKEQKMIKGTRGKFKLLKPQGVTQTTFVSGDEVIEVTW